MKQLTLTLITLLITAASFGQTAEAPANGDGSSSNPYEIANLNNLYWLSQNSSEWDKHYIQTADIDASSTSSWDGGNGFSPIGSYDTRFMGSYDGQNYTIDGLYINRPSTKWIGLFGVIDGSYAIKNLGLTNVDILGDEYVGALTGGLYKSGGKITNCYSTGNVSGRATVGGLFGVDNSSSTSIKNNYSECTVTGDGDNAYELGGFIGKLWNTSDGIYNCYSTGNIKNVSSSGGGFVGYINHSTVENCFSTGDVTRSNTSSSSFGGFCGTITYEPVYIKYSYSLGSVYDTDGSSAFATDKGFVGNEDVSGTYSNNFFDSNISNQSSGTGATAKTTTQMQSQSTFTNNGWDFLGETTNGTDDYWGLTSGFNNDYPFLSWMAVASSTTDNVTNVSSTTATVDGSITDLGEFSPSAHGVCWATTVTPTTADNSTDKGAVSSVYSFSSDISGLSPNTTYYTRSYVTNDAGTTYGEEISFTTNKKEITIDGSFTASNKTYDGSGDAIISSNNLSLSGVVDGDDVNLSNVVVAFASSDVADGIAVNITSADLTGTDANNYILSLSGAPTTTANITEAELTISGASASDKVYDGTTDATITGASINGVISGDDVSLDNAGSGTFAQADVGTGINVSTSMTISGADADNYILTQPSGLSADITAKELTVTGASAESKVYDGTTDATITGASINGMVSGDDVSLDNAGSGTFAQADVGTGINVSTSMTISGTDAGNYTLTQPGGLSADITAKELTVTGASAESKVYDGTTDATITGASINGMVSGDDVSLDNAGSGTFAQADVGTGINVSTSMTISGADAGNYTLTQPGGLSADITAKELTVTGASAESKVYDGTTDATIIDASLNGVVSGDDVSLDNAGSGTFAQADVGTGINVSTSMTISGTDAGNYTLTQPGGLSADITAKELTVTGASAESKIYDGTTDATIIDASLNGVVSGDDVSLDKAGSGTFAQSDVGTGINVSTSMTISGADAGNYTLTQPGGLSADITAKELTVTGASAESKVYDGTTDATIIDASLNGVVSGDDVSLDNAGSGTFAQSDVGTGINVSTSMTISGADAGNYTLTQPGGLSADITAKELTVTGASAESKIYDGTTDATIIDASLNGVVSGDDVSLDKAGSGTFAQSDVGTGINVSTSMTISGAD